MLEVRPAISDPDLEHFARIVSTVSPADSTSVDEIRWSDATYPGGRRFLAWRDGVPVGAGGVGRVHVYPEDFPGLWATVAVLPEHRRRGVGSALLSAIVEAARAAGKSMLVGRTTADRPDAIAFLANRGFSEH